MPAVCNSVYAEVGAKSPVLDGGAEDLDIDINMIDPYWASAVHMKPEKTYTPFDSENIHILLRQAHLYDLARPLHLRHQPLRPPSLFPALLPRGHVISELVSS